MLGSYGIRTDLALEATERFTEENVEIRGVEISEDYDEEKDVRTTVVKITTENGARTMGRPQGNYITIEAPGLSMSDEDYHREISEKLALHLKKLIHLEREQSILVVGLGNSAITADSLGPHVVDNLYITRHMIREYGLKSMGKERMHRVSGIIPGVMAQTGMETSEIVQGIVAETKPDVVIAIDALAARSTKRLNRTIQISDAGIHPGAGVGNHRSVITKETMGIPVIAIGVPTVVDAATIVNDTMENFIAALETSENLKGVGVVLQGYNSAEKYELVKELIAPHLNGMFVTPKDIDETIRRISYTVSEALNLLFSGKAGESEKKEETA